MGQAPRAHSSIHSTFKWLKFQHLRHAPFHVKNVIHYFFSLLGRHTTKSHNRVKSCPGQLMGCPFEIVTVRSRQNFRRELFHDVPRSLAKFISSSCISSVAFSYHSIDLYRCPGRTFLRSLVCSWTLWECGSFFYVLPRRIRTGGTLGLWQSSNPDQNLIRLERRWDALSTIGLACVIIGILLQAAGVWIP